MLGTRPPVARDGSSRTLALAHQEEATALAAAVFLRCSIEREVTLKSFGTRFRETHAILVGPSAVARLAVPLDSLDSLGSVRIARMPNAACLVIATEKHVAYIVKEIEV